jgi:hypothetical protein
MVKKLMKGALAKKVVSEARKPHNQAKAKQAFNSLRGRGKGGAPAR